MAGKGTGTGIGTRAWAESLRLRLIHEVERCMEALQAVDVTRDDVAGIDRHVRCVTNVARAGKAVAALIVRTEEDEAEMSDDDRGGEPEDPAEMERLHHELRDRLERIRSNLEAKRREGWAFTPRHAPDREDDVGRAEASAHA